MNIQDIAASQRNFFRTGATLRPDRRVQMLRRLRDAILAREDEICAALKKDLNKCGFESYMTEVGMALDELNYAIRHIEKWARGNYA